MNTAIRSRKDLENKITMPFLGEIPLLRRRGEKKKWQFWKKEDKDKRFRFVVKAKSRGVLNEAFRVVSTNLDFMADSTSNSSTVFMITSYLPGSGKSFIAANLGAVFSIKNKKVLVIDGDLRQDPLFGEKR